MNTEQKKLSLNSIDDILETRTRGISTDVSESGLNTNRQLVRQQSGLSQKSDQMNIELVQSQSVHLMNNENDKRRSSNSEDSDKNLTNEENSATKNSDNSDSQNEDKREFLSYSLWKKQKVLKQVRTKDTFKSGVPNEVDKKLKGYEVLQSKIQKVAELFLFLSAYNLVASILVQDFSNFIGASLGVFQWCTTYISTRQGQLSYKKKNYALIFSALKCLIWAQLILVITIVMYMYILVDHVKILATDDEISEEQKNTIIYFILIPISIVFISNFTILCAILCLRKKGNAMLYDIYVLILKDNEERQRLVQEKEKRRGRNRRLRRVSEFQIVESDQDLQSSNSDYQQDNDLIIDTNNNNNFYNNNKNINLSGNNSYSESSSIRDIDSPQDQQEQQQQITKNKNSDKEINIEYPLNNNNNKNNQHITIDFSSQIKTLEKQQQQQQDIEKSQQIKNFNKRMYQKFQTSSTIYSNDSLDQQETQIYGNESPIKRKRKTTKFQIGLDSDKKIQ